MSQSSALEKLHQAVKDENLAGAHRAERYEQLTSKMRAYQEGGGIAPTVEEFLDWRNYVEERVALKKLQAGISDAELPVEDKA